MPLDEIVFILTLPVRVEQVSGVVGAAASGPIIAVTDNQIVIDSSLPLDVAPMVKPGMEVTIDEPSRVRARQSRIRCRVAGDRAESMAITFTTRFASASRRRRCKGFHCGSRCRSNRPRDAVTAVPMSAVALGRWQIAHPGPAWQGLCSTLPVEPGLTADGFVEVKPLDGIWRRASSSSWEVTPKAAKLQKQL